MNIFAVQEMEEKEERAVWLKHNGYNCCQSVIKALTEADESLSDAERELLNRAAAGFRTGMGAMEGTCGALCGAIIVNGVKSAGSLEAGLVSKQLHRHFVQLSGASICRILKSPGPNGKILCDCDNCVRHAIRAYLHR